MRSYVLLIIGVLAVLSISCAEIEPLSPEYIIKHPLGTGTIRLGLTDEQVREGWGDPDVISPLGFDELNQPRKEWVYFGQMSKAKVDYQYFSNTQYLYFVGGILVKISDTTFVEQFEEVADSEE